MRRLPTIRLLAAGLALLAALLATQPAIAATLVQLRGEIVVDGPEITLGDLFEGTGERAAAHVAAAPAPGRRSVFRAAAIAALARDNGLDWHRPRGKRTVAVRRASHVVARREILDQLTMALLERTDLADLEVEIADRNLAVHVATDQASTVAIEDLRFDPRRGRFSATLVTPADHPQATRMAVRGRVHEVISVPVLRRHAAVGQVIDAADLTSQRIRIARLGRNAIIDPADAVGKSARRPLRPGRALRAGDLRRPVAVAKGALVTMVYSADGLLLTASGRALEAGAKGDVIRVVNTHSHQTVEALVARAGEVIVRPKARVVSVRR